MPNLNKGRFIGRAIESVLNQTFERLELIIVDNGSKDESIETVERYQRFDTRIKLASESKRGVAYALNNGIGLTKGEYLSVIGSDDQYDPTKIEKQVSVLEAQQEVGLCYTDGWIMDAGDNSTCRSYNHNVVLPPIRLEEAGMFRSLLRYNFVIGGSMLIRKSSLRDERFDTSIRFGEDWDLLVRLSRRIKFCYIDEPLYGYRVYGGNTAGRAFTNAFYQAETLQEVVATL